MELWSHTYNRIYGTHIVVYIITQIILDATFIVPNINNETISSLVKGTYIVLY